MTVGLFSMSLVPFKRINGNWNQPASGSEGGMERATEQAARKSGLSVATVLYNTMAWIKRNYRAGSSFCLSRHINMELIKTARLIEFL